MSLPVRPEVDETPSCQPGHVECLIQEYAPLIPYIAQRLAWRLPSTICLEELISSGALGLLDAIETYEPQRATTFKTYCVVKA